MEVMSKHVVTQFGFADNQFHDNDDQFRLEELYTRSVVKSIKILIQFPYHFCTGHLPIF